VRIGKAQITLNFKRESSAKTSYRVLELEGDLHVIRQPSPWSLTSGWAERVKDAISSLLPGK
jgi:hypothetical protein